MDSDLDAIFAHILANVDVAVAQAVQAVGRAAPERARSYADQLAARLADATAAVATLRKETAVRRTP